MKFAHLGDCHLGGWRQPELRELNFLSFKEAVRRVIKEKVELVLIAGDLFDSPYPPIETLKQTFSEFKKLKDSNIPVFLIAGSHDYSISGKTFLDVLEKAGFSKNVFVSEERDNRIFLQPTIYKNFAIYGYPGKKSGLEVEEIKRIKLQDAPGMFKILMLHTTLRDAIAGTPIPAVDETTLPQVNYLALSHLHINYKKENRAYSGPIFPNNISELEELKYGSFYIIENDQIRREEIKLKEIVALHLELTNAFSATDAILALLKDQEPKNKIVLVRLSGILEKGKISDIDFNKIEAYLKEKEAFIFLKSTSKLHIAEPGIKMDFLDSENLETELIKKFEEKNPSKLNSFIPSLIRSLRIEKIEDETSATFEERLLSESKDILGL